MDKSRIAAALALSAVIGFLAVFFFLGFFEVKTANKDFFNMGFIALINFVSTAFGYYLGSSYGSAMKNSLLAATSIALPTAAEKAQLDEPATRTEGTAGFITLRLLPLLSLGFMGISLAALVFMGGCATDQTANQTPQAIAAKSLLSARQGVIAAATTADALCSQGIMSQADCDKAKGIYTQAQQAYTTASDAFLVYLVANDEISKKQFEDTQPRLMALYTDINSLVKSFKGDN